jgi:hypothetical protein
LHKPSCSCSCSCSSSRCDNTPLLLICFPLRLPFSHSRPPSRVSFKNISPPPHLPPIAGYCHSKQTPSDLAATSYIALASTSFSSCFE